MRCLVFYALIVASLIPIPTYAPPLAPHPRLLASAAEWDHLRERVAAEPDLAAFHAGILDEARVLIGLPPVERTGSEFKLLHVSREFLRRVTFLAYAWRMTGEGTFARRAEKELLAGARFANWNPGHFLDVAEAAAAFALGYDWLHDALSPEALAKIREAIIEKCFQPALDPALPHNHWHRSQSNWSQVCWGGLTLAALAIGDLHPKEADAVLESAKTNIGEGLKPYAPDGIYPEGPGYWIYGTTYQVMMIAALESALGDDWGLRAAPGFMASGGVFRQLIGPTGASFNFGDGREHPRIPSVLPWFAQANADPGLSAAIISTLGRPEALKAALGDERAVFAALWWPRDKRDGTPRLPLDWHGRGKVPVVVFRENWDDPRAAYLATKGGAAVFSHAHMDAGAFIYEVDGIRWAIDLESQNYQSLESKGIDLFQANQESRRWEVYRNNNYSHGTLTIDGRLHRAEGRAEVTRFLSEGDRRLAIIDLSPVFAGQADTVRRGFKPGKDRGFVVQDELTGLKAGQTIRWQWVTRAAIALAGDTAVLTREGRTLNLRVYAPAGAVFNAAPAAPPDNDYDAPNPGVSLLGLNLVASDAPVLTINVQIWPGGPNDAQPSQVVPLADW